VLGTPARDRTASPPAQKAPDLDQEPLETRLYGIENAGLTEITNALRQHPFLRGLNFMPLPDQSRVMVVAPAQLQELVEDLIQKLDVPSASPAQTMRIFRIEHADLHVTEEALKEAIGGRARIIVDPKASRLIVSGDERVMAYAEQLVTQLDEASPPEKHVAKVYALVHIPAREARDMLQQMTTGNVDIAADERTNTIIVIGPIEQVNLIENLIRAVDVPERQSAGTDGRETRMYKTEHAHFGDGPAAEMLEMVLDGQGEFAWDASRRLLVVRGTPAAFLETEQLLKQLDVPPAENAPFDPERSYRIRMVWLTSGLEEEAPPPSDDLTPIAAELEKIGVTDLKEAAQSIFQVSGESRFQLEAQSLSGHDLDVSGELMPDPGPNVRLEIRIEATTVEPRTEGHEKVTLGELRTTLAAPIGHPVVVGAAPMGGSTTRSFMSVFVIQILPGT
jgi:hypothetical protein